MGTVIKLLNEFYTEYLIKTKDPRAETKFLLRSPVPIICIVAFYLYFSLNLGPKIMKNRRPFDLRKIILLYNIFQVIANSYISLLSVYMMWIHNYNMFDCKPPDFSDSVIGNTESTLIYYYYLLKVLDLLDTVFFVLRKKNKQITYLHVYHHAVIATISYIIISYYPGGTISIVGIINCFVHVIMYYYYTVALITKKELWWKKYITVIQLLQFMTLTVHSVNILRQQPCADTNSKYWMIVVFMQSIYFSYLFGSFYVKTYIMKKKA